ncbi:MULTISPECIES: hypothetical protein [Catenuloplanes]|uniref:Uncharacterized protein n=1 Tax=Catenuloplanes niger TaxID=587534 RepID=A0AAE3ZIR1_9ACTN|nr:hypothetical protein [Catenuloplanes niger]MDR7320643.1 hypothetical protein [Catenuloplanes niger]
MRDEPLERAAALLRERNAIDALLADLTGRPMTSGHLGEWIAARIFDIALERSATTAAYDGRFTGGPLAGRTVNVKWYLKRENLLDVTTSDQLDHYLVLTGPASPPAHSRGTTRPWLIHAVHLFDAAQLLAELRTRGTKVGTATSVRAAQWAAAEIYPRRRNHRLPVSADQAAQLALFGAAGRAV